MNRISHLFETKKSSILSIFFTAGYPKLEDTAIVLKALQSRGIDMVEVGIPFSDPMADGPVIQSASTQALRNGMTLSHLFEQLEAIRDGVHIPVILMGYLNPIIQFGFESFCVACVKAGVAGMIIPDLPFADYMLSYKSIADKYDLKMIMLITPETSDERIRQIDAHTDGFIYMVSSASTTGAQSDFNDCKLEYFRRVEALGLRNPRMVGFGISNKQTFDSACSYAAGGIIGSRFVTLLDETASPLEAITRLRSDIFF